MADPNDIIVHPASDKTKGRLKVGPHTFDCALGRGGITGSKREGDGASPVGRFPLRRLFYRADRLTRPKTKLPCRTIRLNDGWCDDVLSPAYNRFIRKPFSLSHEDLWREDHLYDLIVEVGYNDAPPEVGRGSAIFMHVARDGFLPTEGCVALKREDLLTLLQELDPSSHLVISGT